MKSDIRDWPSHGSQSAHWIAKWNTALTTTATRDWHETSMTEKSAVDWRQFPARAFWLDGQLDDSGFYTEFVFIAGNIIVRSLINFPRVFVHGINYNIMLSYSNNQFGVSRCDTTLIRWNVNKKTTSHPEGNPVVWHGAWGPSNIRLSYPSSHAAPNCGFSKGPAPYWSNPLFKMFDIRALWRSGLNVKKF